MATKKNEHRPPYPTAETVIDSEDDVDVEEKVTVGNHKPNKGGVDSWVNKPSQRKGSKHGEKKNGRSDSVKEKSRKWSFVLPPLVPTDKRPHHGKSRTMSMSDIRRTSAGEKPTHLPPKLPLDSITTHTFGSNIKNNNSNIKSSATAKHQSTHSLPTPAASPSSDAHPAITNSINSNIRSRSPSSDSSSSSSSSTSSSSVSTGIPPNSTATAKATTPASVKNLVAAVGQSSSGGKNKLSDTVTSRPGISSNRPRSYSAYPTALSPLISNPSSFPINPATIANSIQKPPTPISPIVESSRPAMPALKKPQRASQPVTVAPSSVVSASSSESSQSESSGSSGSLDRRSPGGLRKLPALQTQNNGYFASVSDDVQSPMPEAPAPPSRGSTAPSDGDSGSDDVKSAEQKSSFPQTTSVPTPKGPGSLAKVGNGRPPVHNRTYSNATVTGPEYDQDPYPYAYPQRPRNSFSNNAVPTGASPGAIAGLGFDNSVFEYLDEGEEDVAEAQEEPSSAASNKMAPASESGLKSPIKPVSPQKSTSTAAATAKPPVHGQESYFSSRPYSGYGNYPQYDAYMSPEGIKAEPVPQSAKPMSENLKSLGQEGGAIVHTPQKSGFKESFQARRAAAAAAVAAESQIPVEATEIEEYNDDDYGYSYAQQPPQSYRGRRMTATQPPQLDHDMYGAYPAPAPPPAHHGAHGAHGPHGPHGPHAGHPQPPLPPHRSYTDSYAPYSRPSMPPPPPPQANPMYNQQYPQRQMPPAGPGAGPGGYPKQAFNRNQVPAYPNPGFGTMLNSGVSELASTVLGGRFSNMNRHPHMAQSNLSVLSSYVSPAYNDYYSYDNYYDDPNAYAEEPEYEEPQSIPSASPQYSKRRPASGDFGAANKRGSVHGPWTAEWADTDSNRGSSRPPTEQNQDVQEREEFELGKDGLDDQSWAKPAKVRRRNTVTNKQTTFSSTFSDASSAKLTSAASSRMQALSEVDIKSDIGDPRQPPSINTNFSQQKHGLPTPEDSPPAVKQCRAASRPPTRHSNVTASALKNATVATIPTAQGYRHLSNHLTTTPSNAMYRRFDNLNHRILLHLQDEICELETMLDSLDNSDQHNGGNGAGLKTRRGLNGPAGRATAALDERSARRLELMGAIFLKLQQYNNALAAYSKILNELPSATSDNLDEYRQWMTIHQPVVQEEMDFVFRANDFSSIAADSSRPVQVHMTSPRSSRSPSISAQAPVIIEGVLEGVLAWMNKQDTPTQLGVLASVFFILPLLLFLSTSTFFGIMLLMTLLTAGFCASAAKILYKDGASTQSSKSAAERGGKADAPPADTSIPPSEIKA